MPDTVNARIATRAAFQVRRALSIPRESPANSFDVAASLGIDVRFVDAKSLDGMFVRDPGPKIIVPCLTHRPRARIAYSCAHEIGHYQLGHGTWVDEYVAEAGSERHSAEEYSVDTFAATLLMPRQAVLSAFERRALEPATSTPQQLAAIACELGVGLRTLVARMTWGLEILPKAKWPSYRQLRRSSVVESLLGPNLGRDVLVVDQHWSSTPIDLEVGMIIALPLSVLVHTDCIKRVSTTRDWGIWKGAEAGIGEAAWTNIPQTIRVARAGYTGLYKHRYLPEESE